MGGKEKKGGREGVGLRGREGGSRLGREGGRDGGRSPGARRVRHRHLVVALVGFERKRVRVCVSVFVRVRVCI